MATNIPIQISPDIGDFRQSISPASPNNRKAQRKTVATQVMTDTFSYATCVLYLESL